MSQLNVIVTPEFDRDLQRLMKTRAIRTKSEAVRLAVHELAKRGAQSQPAQFGELLGAGLRVPLNSNRKIQSEDDLWS